MKSNSRRFALFIILFTALFTGCLVKADNTPTFPTPSLQATSSIEQTSPSKTATSTYEPSSPILAKTPSRESNETESESQSNSPNPHDLLRTRFAGLDLTAAARLTTPTPNLIPSEPHPVLRSPLALSPANAKQMQLLTHFGSGQINDLELSPDGRYLAVAGIDGVYVFETGTLKEQFHLAAGSKVTGATFNQEGNRLAIVSSKAYTGDETSHWSAIDLYSTVDGEHLATMEGLLNSNTFHKIIFGPDNTLVGGGQWSDKQNEWESQQIVIWDIQSGQVVFSYLLMGLFSMDLNNETGQLLVQEENRSLGNEVIRFDLKNGSASTFDIYAMYYPILNADGSWVVGLSTLTNTLQSRRWGTMSLTANNALTCVEVLRSGDRLVCAGHKSIVYVDPITLESLVVIDSPGEVTQMTADQTGQLAWVQDGGIGLWARDSTGQQHFRSIAWQTIGMAAAGILQINDRQVSVVAGALSSGKIVVWAIDTGTELAHLSGYGLPVIAIAFSPDLRSLAWIDANQTVFWWDILEEREIQRYDIPQQACDRLWFSTDNQSLFLPDRYGDSVMVLNLGNGMLHTILARNSGDFKNTMPIYLLDQVAFYNHSEAWYLQQFDVLQANRDGSISNTDLTFKSSFGYYVYRITGIVSSRDGRYLAVAGDGYKLLVFDLQERTSLYELETTWLPGTDEMLKTWAGSSDILSFSPGGGLLAIVNLYGEAALLNLANGKEVLHFYLGPHITFTPDDRFLIGYGNGAIMVWGLP